MFAREGSASAIAVFSESQVVEREHAIVNANPVEKMPELARWRYEVIVSEKVNP